MRIVQLLSFLLFLGIFACQKNSEQNTEFAKAFEGDWKLKKLTGERRVADSVIKKFPVTLNVKDTAFLFRQATQYGQATYRNWIFEDSMLLLPYSNAEMQEDTLFFKVLNINEKELTLQRQNKMLKGFDTLYFERY